MSRALLDESHLTATKLPVLLLARITDDQLVAVRPLVGPTHRPGVSRPHHLRPVQSRRPLFARVQVTRPFKSRRTFNALNRCRVRVLPAAGPIGATPAAGSTAQTVRSDLSEHINDLSDNRPTGIRTTSPLQPLIVRPSAPPEHQTQSQVTSTPRTTDSHPQLNVRHFRITGVVAAHLVHQRKSPHLRQYRTDTSQSTT